MSESNATTATEAAVPAPAAEEKKESKTENMEVEAPATDAPSDEASTEEDAPAADKPAKGKAKAAPKKKAAAPKKAAAAPKKSPPRKAQPASPPKPAAAPAAVVVKPKAAPAPKKPATKESSSGAASSHPPYLEMIVAAVENLKERNGSSRQAILKYITTSYELGVDAKMANVHLKQALKRGVTTGTLKNTKVKPFPIFELYVLVVHCV